MTTPAAPTLIDCTEAEHAGAILAILNEAIVSSTALYDYHPRPPEAMATWFKSKRDNGFPVLGLVNDAGELLGFASWGAWRTFPAYKYSVEHSIYVHKNHRGHGYASLLLKALLARAETQQLHMLVGAIDASNAASIALHQKHGFTDCGTVRQAGFKFGRWLDVAFYQKILATPAQPIDG